MIWLPLVSFGSEPVAFERDRLLKVDLGFFPRYRAILLNKLASTSFDCGRVVFKPAFAPEYSVSVYSRATSNKPTQYFVTCIKADLSLNDRMEPGIDPREAQAVKTHRSDCEIPKKTAENVRQAWLGLLSGNKRPRPMRLEDAARTTDTTVAEFSIQLSRAKVLYGEEIAAELPQGPKTKMLVDLANTLANYCKSKRSDRAAVASEIDQKATRLLEMLKQK
jgi:hypothetical protein